MGAHKIINYAASTGAILDRCLKLLRKGQRLRAALYRSFAVDVSANSTSRGIFAFDNGGEPSTNRRWLSFAGIHPR